MADNMPKYGQEINFVVEILSESNRSMLDEYNCGDPQINIHIKMTSNRYNGERAFLVIDNLRGNVIAFFSLRATALVFDSQDGRGIRLAPAVEIVTFAVDVRYQDMWMSEKREEGCLSNYILSYIIDEYINYVNKSYCAIEFVVLYSVDSAVEFYKKTLFCPFNEFMVKSRDPYIKLCTPMYFDLSKYNETLNNIK